MQQIATCLMFVGEQCGRAEEAVEHWVSLFEDSRLLDVERFEDAGVERIRFLLAGREHVAMDSDAPHPFGFTPAISLFVDLDDREALDRAYAGLADGGTELMPLGAYPFSPHFGWVQDRYGVSWQLRLV
jgi:predicted 3-demethylubiquinone-9 3-methyltransferase (glyoxalase superfamily)